MIDFEFLIHKSEEPHSHSDLEVFYVMQGTADFALEDKMYHLGKDDFLVVNVDKKHSFHAGNDFIAACMHVSYSKLSKMLRQNFVFFWCNTAIEDNESAEVLRSIIRKIIGEQYVDKGQDEIYIQSLYFEFLHVLTHDFLLNREDRQYSEEEHKFDERKHTIVDYIRMNYDKQISLGDLANRLYLSTAYLSKYIKRQFGMSFVDYVNSVRLGYAVSQLLYSDKSVVRIAMDTGFASSAALNKAFREKYDMTPTVYRQQWKDKARKNKNTVEDEAEIQKRLTSFFQENPVSARTDRNLDDEVITFNRSEKRVLYKNWNRMINIGGAADLLNSEMRAHVLGLKDELHFTYVRFWDLYAPEMFLDIHEKNHDYNFSKLDRVLDFLVKNKLKPYMELRVKPKKIISNPRKVLMLNEMDVFYEDNAAIARFNRALIIHLINRYTAEEVETWYFEVWKTELEKYLMETNIEDKNSSIYMYLDCFETIAGVLREYLPDIQIGGGGFALRYGEEHFRDILRLWKMRRQLPNFISIYNYPYTPGSIDRDRNQTMDADFIKKHMEDVLAAMRKEAFPEIPLHVSEWSFSVSSRNILNDHCMKGAYLVKNMIDSIGMADIMGYWVGSDLYADYYDSRLLLSGSGGLLTKDGIPKPAFYAFSFMNRLGKYLRKRGENYIITDNGQGNWRIVCHNLKNLSYHYGLLAEDEVILADRNNLFVNQKKRCLHFALPAIREGKYFLRSYSVNQKWGSIQDVWEEMIGPVELGPEDLEYLSRITIPRMAITRTRSQGGRICFDVVLEPNEIQFIHVSYQL